MRFDTSGSRRYALCMMPRVGAPPASRPLPVTLVAVRTFSIRFLLNLRTLRTHGNQSNNTVKGDHGSMRRYDGPKMRFVRRVRSSRVDTALLRAVAVRLLGELLLLLLLLYSNLHRWMRSDR
jgi:hypothetical protein